MGCRVRRLALCRATRRWTHSREGIMPQNVVLPGPAPWGFRLSGGIDFNQPLVITRVGVFHSDFFCYRSPGVQSGPEITKKPREGGRMVHWQGSELLAPRWTSAELGGCKAVMRFNQGSSQTLHPFSLVLATFPREINWQCGFLGSE